VSSSSLLTDFKGDPIEKAVRPLAVKPKRSQQSILRRSKRSERDLAKWQQEHDGPDPKYKHLTTSTGRIGHITQLEADTLSKHYLGENKNEIVPKKWLLYWQKINSHAVEWGKDALLRFEPSNRDDVDHRLPDMHIITPSRHAELLRKERWYDERNGS
jgi:hypothetical protein